MPKELDLSDKAPWRQRYRAAKIAWAQVATGNPERGVACTDRDGIMQLYAWEVGTGVLRRATDLPAGVVAGMISADGTAIIYHKDEQGNEIGHLVRVSFEGGPDQDLTPDLPPYASRGAGQSRSGNVIGLTMARQESGFEVAVLADGGTPRTIYHSRRLAYGPVLSADGTIAIVASSERSGRLDYQLLAFDVASGEPIAELWDGEGASLEPGPFSPRPGDGRLLAASSRSGYARPLLWDPRSGERTDLAIDTIPGTVTPCDWSPDGRRVLLSQLHQATYQLYTYDLTSAEIVRLDHPAGVLSGARFTAQGEIITVWQDAAHPPCLIALDGRSGVQRRTVLQAGSVPAGSAGRRRSIVFRSEQGEAIQGWLSVPDGEGPFPTILHTHGGPTAVQTDTYSPAEQAWLDHGFAFLSINYHGSTTFGKAFEKSIWGNLGDLEVQDMAAATRWLVEQGIAQPDAVFLIGGSYGGYLTLQALGRRPELWAGGMAAVAIADWKLMYEDQAETLRGYQRGLFGGTPDETPEATRASSPITYTAQIQAPILVIQGRNDTRCPARQMEAYEARLKALGKSIAIHWFDAGHGSRAQEQQIDHQERMMRFVYQVLGSRCRACSMASAA